MLSPRRLAAIDLAFLGPKVVIIEFLAGIFLSIALGVFVLIRGHGARLQIALGLYWISLGINYIPMFIYAIQINRSKSATKELGSELDNKTAAMAKYRRQSVWLLVPFIVPFVALRSVRKAPVDEQ